MKKFKSKRNFGFGRQMPHAAKNALRTFYGENRRYGTVASNASRTNRFAEYIYSEYGIKRWNYVELDHVMQYAESLKREVIEDGLSLTYAHNLLSSLNRTLFALRADHKIWISPKSILGPRAWYRESPPQGLDRHQFTEILSSLDQTMDRNVLSVLNFARWFGLRFREAALLDIRTAIAEFEDTGTIRITRGTKGGRGKKIPRIIAVCPNGEDALRSALKHLEGVNLCGKDSYIKFSNSIHNRISYLKAYHGFNLKGAHELRSAYACQRWFQIVGEPAPVCSGKRDKQAFQIAAPIIANELGHDRPYVIHSYTG